MDENVVKENVTAVETKSPIQHKGNNDTNSLVNVNTQNNSGSGLSTINLFDEKQLIAAENFITKVMRSDKGGIKSVNDGLAILMRAQDLNLPFSTCIEHIHVINGKTGIDIHVIKALLLKAGCTWRCLKDYQPLYEYTDNINVYVENAFPEYVVRCSNQKEASDKNEADTNNEHVYVYPVKWYADFNGNIYKDYQLNINTHKVVTSKAEAIALVQQKKIGVYRIANKPVDYITEYEITRTVNGKQMTVTGKFTYSEAMAADLFSKDTYKKYPKVLIGHRAFTYAARDIASDILFGVMETTELKIVSGKELSNEDIIDISAEEIN